MHDDIISTLTDWIDNNLEKTLSIDEVAAKSGYSKWHLQRMFRSVTKQTLGGYIRERRLTLAAEALRLTQRPVFDIAMQYGYDSQQTFSRVFRRQFSQTPTAYRHSMRPASLKRSSWTFDCSDYATSSFSQRVSEKSCPTCS
ncbi:superoxide response transcriptional regulator SoxS [Erwinia rhapontici]|uniref:superoxide response transcriptional regulator SoxS n=1 Tax=Erwinia rhapontici TaxID=55212 RepID=UPI00105D5C29|nr:superoxide response transcriptional regulator SoxS [Erwinia rhapontici]MCS3608338.1 AraC family mar-sox-rob regulon transcriptional activator [Erwinia rhapontici]TDT00807.1 AraC family mar-sox-rob regulon transcriptional activator [Erwinia rhapontici]